jgi:hypothetical protein
VPGYQGSGAGSHLFYLVLDAGYLGLDDGVELLLDGINFFHNGIEQLFGLAGQPLNDPAPLLIEVNLAHSNPLRLKANQLHPSPQPDQKHPNAHIDHLLDPENRPDPVLKMAAPLQALDAQPHEVAVQAGRRYRQVVLTAVGVGLGHGIDDD